MGGGGRDIMIKDVTKFHKRHLGGLGILECIQGFIQDFEFGGGGGKGNSKVRC